MLFVLLSAIPLVALGWLGWHLLAQDRALETQRLRERLDNSADLVARELERGLAAWEGLLSTAAQGNSAALPAGAALIVFDSRGIATHQGDPLPYYPVVLPQPEPSAEAFVASEALEFREEDLAKAAASYRDLASSRDPGVRGGVTKPYSTRELRARVKAHLRRGGAPQAAGIYRFGDAELDFTRCELRRGGKPVELSALEFKLLSAFARRSGRLMTRELGSDLQQVGVASAASAASHKSLLRWLTAVPRGECPGVNRCFPVGGTILGPVARAACDRRFQDRGTAARMEDKQ
jgi:hypothetical protein